MVALGNGIGVAFEALIFQVSPFFAIPRAFFFWKG
jgi:hypothetical protein